MPELLVLADGAMAAGKTHEAVKYLKKILFINRRKHSALLDLAECYIKLGKFSDCFRLLQRAIKYYPDDFEFHHIRGFVHARVGLQG